MRNGDVTRYVTGRVTVPRPDPTRPDPCIRAEVSIHDLRLLVDDKRMGDFVASSRGAR